MLFPLNSYKFRNNNSPELVELQSMKNDECWLANFALL